MRNQIANDTANKGRKILDVVIDEIAPLVKR